MLEVEYSFAPDEWQEFTRMGVEGIWANLYFITNEGVHFQHPPARWQLSHDAVKKASYRLKWDKQMIHARMSMTPDDFVLFKLKFQRVDADATNR